jgi:hypothetical protein
MHGTGLVACPCGTVSYNPGLAHHKKRGMCEGFEATRTTSAVMASTSHYLACHRLERRLRLQQLPIGP